MKRVGKFWLRFCRALGARSILTFIYPGLTPTATFFHPLRGFLEGPRFLKTPGWRVFVMLSAAFVSLSGSTPYKILLTKTGSVNEDKIDAALQQAATEALGQHEGAIIVIDPQTGRMRAVVNPQLAFAQAQMPGSTIKPFTAVAALRAGFIKAGSRTVCPGRFTGRSFSLPCVHADHLPPFTPSQAIAYSCNYYFARLGQRMGPDQLTETLRPFGFGQATGVTADEAKGVVRPCEAGNSSRIRAPEKDRASQASDCNAREAIGESDHIQITPIQLLMAYAVLLNGGRLLQPRLVPANDFQLVERSRTELLPEHQAIITEGLRGAVRYGTAKNAHLDSLPVYVLGKTGTSMPAKGFRPNGWFVGFASEDNNDATPDVGIGVLVILQNSHGAEAAALSKSIFEAYADTLSKPATARASTPLISAQQSAVGNRQSAIRIHLVHDNLTLELSLEDYVLGVLRAEGGMETEPEALKALAIVIRTYALKNHGRHAKEGYDFCSTTHCQRFLPGGVRSPRVSKGAGDGGAITDGRASDSMIAAVKSTEGQVLLDDRGQPVDAYFGASCGGQTANIGSLWGTNPPSYLRGVRDEYCVTGPHASWTDAIRRADLLRALRTDARTDVGSRLDQVIVSQRDETGRAEFITLEGEHRKIVRGWDFKIIVGRVLGWNLLKSSRFEIAQAGQNFIFRGSGFGHGLGLCQEGAHVMAARGSTYQRILEKYFPGTSVARRDQFLAQLNRSKTPGLNAEDAKVVAKGAEENLSVPLRKPLRSLRLNAAFEMFSARAWKTDLLFASRTIGNVTPRLSSKSNRYFTISSEHFRVTYPANVEYRDADLVLRTLETARADYLHRASTASVSIGDLPVLEIRLNNSTGDFTSRTGQPWWAAAATKGNRIELQPVAILKRRGVLTTTLRHELAHAVIDAVSRNRAPRWLEEGFAIYLAGEGPTISRYATRGARSTVDLEKRLEHPGSQQEMQALYAMAYQKVIELVRGSGEAAVWKQLVQT